MGSALCAWCSRSKALVITEDGVRALLDLRDHNFAAFAQQVNGLVQVALQNHVPALAPLHQAANKPPEAD